MVLDQKPIEEQENVPPDGNRVSVGSLDSVCLSDGQEGTQGGVPVTDRVGVSSVVDLGDGHVRDSFLSQEEQFYEDYQDVRQAIIAVCMCLWSVAITHSATAADVTRGVLVSATFTTRCLSRPSELSVAAWIT